MPGRDIVVVGFSAGGIDPLMRLAADLPRDFPASILVVHHFPAQSVSALPSILNRAGPLRASQAEDGERYELARIYVARPDRHLSIRDGRIRLTAEPREHGHRPAIDPLFRSAARSCGTRVVRRMPGMTKFKERASENAVRVSCMPLALGPAEQPRGVILLMEELDGRG